MTATVWIVIVFLAFSFGVLLGNKWAERHIDAEFKRLWASDAERDRQMIETFAEIGRRHMESPK